MTKFLKTNWPLLVILAFTTLFFSPVILKNKLPIPADTIVGLYHPWRDFFKNEYTSGIPFKNFQITDSVRQQYPWRKFAIEEIKKGIVPWWNPYSFSGMPLIANLQSAVFYPLNLFYLLAPFNSVWAFQIILEMLLGGLFMFLYLRSLGLKSAAVLLGSIAWSASGFFIAWLEWNTTVHVAIWLPLMLLSIENISIGKKSKLWMVVLIVAIIASFLAGYLQPFFYVIVVSFFYALWKSFRSRALTVIIFLICLAVALAVFFPQLLSTLQLIKLSARDIDQANWQRSDWFLPWQNLVQFVAPDFFGNPATLNYFGIWNYQEFVGYIGIVPLVFSFAGLFFSKISQKKFFVILLASSLIFCLPNPIASLPFVLNLPLISTAQPSRLILVVVFALSVLCSFGFDWFLDRQSIKKILYVSTAGLMLSIGLFGYTILNHLTISTHNMYLPLIIFSAMLAVLFLYLARVIDRKALVIFIIVITLLDLLRFGWKFEPFSPSRWLYPKTKTLSFLENESTREAFRIAAIDDKLIPPNFSVSSKLQMISGYDPLYLKSYGEYIVAMERGKPDISLPWGFNRIIVPKNYNSKLFNLLNVKYVLSLDEINSRNFRLVMTEGQTRIYQNMSYVPRVFFVSNVLTARSKQEILSVLLGQGFDPSSTAVIQGNFTDENKLLGQGSARIVDYQSNSVRVLTDNDADGFLVLLDIYYPGWYATIDNQETKIYSTDYLFRGVKVPAGQHEVIYKYVFDVSSALRSLR